MGKPESNLVPSYIIDSKEIDDDEMVRIHQAFARYSPEVLAELRFLRAENVRLSTWIKRLRERQSADDGTKPWMMLLFGGLFGMGWPLAFGQYLLRFGFDAGAVPYAIFTLLYLTMIGILALNTIFPRR